MKLRHGTFSYLPDLTDEEIAAQVRYALDHRWPVSVEYTDDPHPRNVYWDMWGLPMFDLVEPDGVLAQISECRRTYPDHYIRVTAYDASLGRQSTAMSFLVQAFLERSPRAAIEVPCYDRMVTLLKRNGAEISTISRLSGRVDLDAIRDLADGDGTPGFLYTMPSFHNPSGLSMTVEEREALADLAVELELVLVEDDPYGQLRIDGEPAPDLEILGNLGLIIGGGFDTTTALTAHSLEWLSDHPDQRELLSRERDTLLNPATEEFLRFFTPAPGDGRTFSENVEVEGTKFKEGERLWISWAMANRDPAVFEDPNEIILDRKGNRHFSFGIGVHRCVGSNVARTVFKSMLTAVLDRMPDYVCDPAGTEHYETIGVIQGMKHLPATFTPSKPLGPGLDETLDKLQRICDEQELARPITERKETAVID